MKIPILVLAVMLTVTTAASAQTIDRRALGCIAHVVYGEGRGEPIEDQLAIGHSVENRRKANLPYFGGSDICNVAYKMSPRLGKGPLRQYDGAYRKIKDVAAWKRSEYVAELVLLGIGRPKQFITYFCNPTISPCSWHRRDLTRVSIGNTGGQHRYYIDPDLQMPAHLASYR